MVQGELFREESSYPAQSGVRKSFLSRYQITVRLDQILFLSIGMIFALTLSHSFGVERGKRLAEKKFEALIPTQVQVFPQDPLSKPREIIETEETVVTAPSGPSDITLNNVTLAATDKDALEVSEKNESKKAGNFTIQLVTYDDEQLAEKEIIRLKSKGYEGFVIPSGRFYQVCANYFSDKSKARSKLQEFKQMGRYPDAYIRPVIR